MAQFSSMIFGVTNLTEQSITPCEPGAFVPTENLTEEIRKNKAARQAWYKNPNTRHLFYSTLEGATPNQRVSKVNPPRFIHGLAVEYDLPIPDARIDEAVAAMKIKPAWVERSLGGNVRIVFLFSRPLLVETFDFAVFVLQASVKWLRLEFLPGMDAPALTDPSRLLCSGEWRAVGECAPIPEDEAQAFFVSCGKAFRSSPSESAAVPLDVVEAALKERFPNFSWPTAFELNSQGPSYWIPESITPLSAIVKADGMFSFSAHAAKPFYSWAEILGAGFVEQFTTRTISAATTEIFWDSKRFWRKIQGRFCSLDSPELTNYFQVQCRMTNKPGPDGITLIQSALDHIYINGRIAGAAPHLFRPPGVLEFHGRRVLNTYLHNVLPPAPDATVWGDAGDFPFLSRHFDNLFDPSEQRFAFLAWWKSFYESGLNLRPMPGQNTFLMGGVNVGKTLTSRALVGRSVGGFSDASSFLLGSESFNSDLLESPLWTVDDETMGESSQSQTIFQAMLKKTAANQTFRHSKKFEIGTTTEWMGRIIVTTNLDYVSSRALGPMDNGSADKTNVFRCASAGRITFPNRHDLSVIIDRELPYLLRWLLDWDPASSGISSDVRYGYAAHHEKSLVEQATQSSKAAPFKELLFESLSEYFQANPDCAAWRGSLTQIVRLLHSNPLNETVCRSLRLETGQRYLDMLQRDQSIPCSTESGPLNTRIWNFPRFIETVNVKPAPGVTLNLFSK